MSTDQSEEGFKGLVDLAGGDIKLVLAALEPLENGEPVTYEQAVDRIVQVRIAREGKNLTVVADL
ncbi:hypothetical protein G3O06_10335 [Burkholderia sp. Ac-20345]|uniref:hypothetical protein n=1 Tax=Burkholderia sp. Ac-20345 TaxID=2703891 RepID=UPI00197BBF8A|nr:hypothetical protein [Burkholderia sp. Ac-20345]MBN3777951.1 hypothetical protein [Burkholderia sp. Ac-20345]